MELAAQYAYKIYEKGSFSAAARALYISQPALSSMIGKLETELGFKIFLRTTPIRLTERGRIYIDALAEIQESEENMRKRLARLSSIHSGRLSVGSSVYLADELLTEATRRFCISHPKSDVKLNMGIKGSQNSLLDALDERDIDLLIDYKYNEERHKAIPIIQVRTVVAAKRNLDGIEPLLPYALSREQVLKGDMRTALCEKELELFSDVGFITTDTLTGYKRQLTELIGNNYSLSRCSVKNIRHMGTNYKIMKAGLGATLALDIHLGTAAFDDDDIVYFAINNKKSVKTLNAIHRIGEEPSREAADFIGYIKDLCLEMKRI